MLNAQVMGWLRTAVGVGLIAAPAAPLKLAGQDPDAATVLLMRTIGIRDLVLGLGTIASGCGADGDGTRWLAVTLASDALDVVVSLASMRGIGKRDAIAAAALGVIFAAGDVQALRAASAVSRRPA